MGPQVWAGRPGLPGRFLPITSTAWAQSRKFEPGHEPWRARKARRKGPTSCQTIPSYPHHNKVSYHISQHHRHQASSTKLHSCPTQISRSFCILLPPNHPPTTASRCNQSSPLRPSTISAPTAPVTQFSPPLSSCRYVAFQEPKHSPLRPIAIPLRHRPLPQADNSPRDVPPSPIYTTLEFA